MQFELPDELDELRLSVRRLAQDKVRPRARAIDKDGTYPADLFAAFRDAGLLGLCVPADYGGSGAGILGLALAIEEVAKYSNTAALMLLLTRLPTGPVMIAGTDEQKKRYLPGICDGSQRGSRTRVVLFRIARHRRLEQRGRGCLRYISRRVELR